MQPVTDGETRCVRLRVGNVVAPVGSQTGTNCDNGRLVHKRTQQQNSSRRNIRTSRPTDDT
eukprot:m.144287 g.144287  ORF g.144287 m.144287 type:complete len:61 (-) comp11600_c0_seq4:446-628(-)